MAAVTSDDEALVELGEYCEELVVTVVSDSFVEVVPFKVLLWSGWTNESNKLFVCLSAPPDFLILFGVLLVFLC